MSDFHPPFNMLSLSGFSCRLLAFSVHCWTVLFTFTESASISPTMPSLLLVAAPMVPFCVVDRASMMLFYKRLGALQHPGTPWCNPSQHAEVGPLNCLSRKFYQKIWKLSFCSENFFSVVLLAWLLVVYLQVFVSNSLFLAQIQKKLLFA